MQTKSDVLPVRGQDAVEILKNDHQVIKTLLDALTDSQGKARGDALDRLKAALTIHNATEENLVYPALQTVANDKASSEQLYHETAEADVLVFKLDTMLKEHDDADFAAKAANLKQAVHAHIAEEETSAFPELQKKADGKQAESLTAAVREFRAAFRFDPGA